MRCLYRDCPMYGKSGCPAYLKCPEFRRTMTLRYNVKSGDDLGYCLNLSPIEAVELYEKLSKIVGCIPDHGNPPIYWPSEKDEVLTESELSKLL